MPKVAVMVLSWITLDQTPLVSSYQPSFHAVPVTVGPEIVGAAVATAVLAGGVTGGGCAGWLVHPQNSTASARRAKRIAYSFFIGK
jgi:hypothetical protein